MTQGKGDSGNIIMIRAGQMNQRLETLRNWFIRVKWASEKRPKLRPKIADLTR
jgi:hypothetical protein